MGSLANSEDPDEMQHNAEIPDEMQLHSAAFGPPLLAMINTIFID